MSVAMQRGRRCIGLSEVTHVCAVCVKENEDTCQMCIFHAGFQSKIGNYQINVC